MQEPKYLLISTPLEMVRIQEESILYIDSEGNYSNIYVVGGEKFFVSYQLGQIEEMIDQQLCSSLKTLVRIGRTKIVNLRYLCYIHTTKQVLSLLDPSGKKYDLSASKDALIMLKKAIEKIE